MASSGEYGQKGDEKLKQEVTCPICHDFFQEPKILPCLHYYCKECVKTLAQRVLENEPFSCPECRTEIVLPNGSPDNLPTAFFINRMKEVYDNFLKVLKKVEAKCEMCFRGIASAFCRHCTYFICAECVKSHERMRVFAEHKVSTLDELNDGGQENIVAKLIPPLMCKVHDEKAKIYCYECNCLICRDCIVKDHKEHKYGL